MRPTLILVAAQAIGLVILLLAVYALIGQSVKRAEKWHLDTCHALMADRLDAARGFLSNSQVLQEAVDRRIAEDATVPESLKDGARLNRRAAASMRSRLLECVPLVEDRRHVPDEAARADALAGP